MTEEERKTERAAAPAALWKAVSVGLLVVMLLAAGELWWAWERSRVTEETVQRTVVTTLQRESPASFLVTGTLHLTATTTVRNTKTFLPNVLDFSMGTTESTVRMPGRVSYGFDVRRLEPEHIRLREDGVVEVTIPALSIHAVEPDLSKMEVKTNVGWARLYRSSGRRVEQEAVQVADRALRAQATDHLKDAAQPQINTARAMREMLTPVLESAGLEDPQFMIQIGPEIVMQPDG